MKTYQFRLYPSRQQLKLFFKQLEVHKNLYNECLEEKINSYKETGKSPSCFDQIKTNIKNYKGLSNYSSMQQTIRRLDKTYSSFFRGGGFPRFKKYISTIEYSKIGDGCKIKNDHLYLQLIGDIKINLHRDVPQHIKTISVTFKYGNLYLNIITDESTITQRGGNKSVGIDFGIQSTITTSNGEKFISPKLTKSRSKDLARLQRKKEKAKNKRKIKKAIAKIHTKIENKRKDFNHKLSRKIVNEYDIICLEDLKVSKITTNIKNINSRIYDIGICQIKQFISYKAESAGKKVILVDPKYTTQKCSQCGNLVQKELKERIHKCGCGLEIDRDINAAINIKGLGLDTLRKLEAS